jgi:hypothetical protein
MYQQQLQYPFEKNWATNNQELRRFYGLSTDDCEISVLSETEWRGIVKKVVRRYAHNVLLQDCQNKKKTQNISFSDYFVTQQYLTSYPTKVALTIFKVRSRSTNCLANRGSSDACRLCGYVAEDQEHVLNCEQIRNGGRELSLRSVELEVPVDEEVVAEIAERFLLFQEKIEEL